jgi:hypothetical protein
MNNFNDGRISELLNKLDSHLLHQVDGSNPSISPTTLPGIPARFPGNIHKGMTVETMNQDELCLLHVNLHRFYPRGIGSINRKDIEEIHKRVSPLLKNHKNYDGLDIHG